MVRTYQLSQIKNSQIANKRTKTSIICTLNKIKHLTQSINLKLSTCLENNHRNQDPNLQINSQSMTDHNSGNRKNKPNFYNLENLVISIDIRTVPSNQISFPRTITSIKNTKHYLVIIIVEIWMSPY